MLTKTLWGLFLLACVNFSAEAWERTYGEIGTDDVANIASTLDRGFVLAETVHPPGSNSSDVLVRKLNGNGELVWLKRFDRDSYDVAVKILPIDDGGYMLISNSRPNWYVDYDSVRIWLLRLDSSGDMVWTRIIGSGQYTASSSIVQTRDGNYLIGAETNFFSPIYYHFNPWLILLNSDGDSIWTRHLSIETDLMFPLLANESIEGTFQFCGNSGGAIWLTKFNTLGDSLGTRYYRRGERQCYANKIITLSDGGCAICGVWGGPDLPPEMEAWILRLDSDGDTVFDKVFASNNPNFDAAMDLITNSDNVFWIVGTFCSPDWRDSDVWAFRLDSEGTWITGRTFGGTQLDRGRSIIRTSNGDFVIAGNTCSYDDSLGDCYVVRFDSLGNSTPEIVESSLGEHPARVTVFFNDDNLSLSISVPRPTPIHLTLLNSLGQTVLPLADRTMPAGETRLEIPLPKLAEGVYVIDSRGALPITRVVVW